MSESVRGKSVLHINSTTYGGGVVEVLKGLVPLLNSVGLRASWKAIIGSEEFFRVTKKLHNALQGMPLDLTESEGGEYIRCNELNGNALQENYDITVFHDPQLLPMINFIRNGGKSVWRCHLDLSDSNSKFWHFAKDFMEKYDALVFSSARYIKKDIIHKKLFIIPPSIDPLTDKNREISENEILSILQRYDIREDAPIITQVSRFDPWKDPIGAIEVYRMVRERVPNAQLLLVGALAHDDPEGIDWLNEILEHTNGHRNIHVLCNVGDLEVNALQRASSVVLQNSKREGFGLTVTEALWKGIPVVARGTGGIPLQIINGVTGCLVNSPEEATLRILHLIKHANFAKALGLQGREHVRRNFLITRQLAQHLMLYSSLIE